MELADFTRLVETYGADPRRWPQARRAAALALVQRNSAAAAMLDEARVLDEILDAAPEQAPSLVLRTTVAAAALGGNARPSAGRRRARAGTMRRPVPRRWAAAAVIAAACAAGVVTGVAAATRQVLPGHAVVSADPALDAGRLIAEPQDAEG